jgi:hypothetical protein
MRKITARVVRGEQPDGQFDKEFWSSLTAAERFEQTWKLSEFLWRISGRGHF